MKQTEADRYASVFESKQESRVRREREGVLEEAGRIADRSGCPWCEVNEAHLHGSTLYQEGRALF